MKVILGADYGCGWSTEYAGDAARLLATYPSVIEAIERGDTLTSQHPAIVALRARLQAMKVTRVPTTGGLVVENTERDEPFTILEYDGQEYIQYQSDFVWFTPGKETNGTREES